MIDLNHIFLFLALVSPVVVLLRGWRPRGPYQGWRIAAGIVLAVTGAAWLLFRKDAGYIGGGAWLALLFLPAIGLKRMSELSARHEYRAARRLASAVRWLHPSAELREQIRLLRALESRQQAGEISSSPPVRIRTKQTKSHLRNTPAVFVLMALNVMAFLFEIAAGAWSDPQVLHTLGALEPYAVVVQHQYWRLVTALFLHYDITHLLFNVFALYVLGPPLERAVGAVRFSVCYLLAGLGSTGGVVALTMFGVIRAVQLIGASGSVMGIVGGWAAFLLQHRHMPMAKRRLNNIIMIVVIQTAFDLTTPQVSMSAHLCGLVAGFLVGIVINPVSRGPGDFARSRS